MKIEYTPLAKKQLKNLDRYTAQRIKNYMDEVAKLKDPKCRGKALTGNLKGMWRYRVGDYRVLCRIKKQELVISVVKIGNRSDVYLGG